MERRYLDRRVAACEPDAPRQAMRDEAFWSPKLDAFKRAVEDDARNCPPRDCR
jgi:hypothetical protein